MRGHYYSGSSSLARVYDAPQNAPPIGFDDSLLVAYRGSSSVLVSGLTRLLDNDTDAEGSALTVVGNTQGLHGSVLVNPDGTFRYTHTGTALADSFEYTLSDGVNASTANVIVSVIADSNQSPVLGDDSIAVSKGGTSTTLTNGLASLLSNDTDPGDVMVVTGYTDPAHGTVVVLETGEFQYTHNGDAARVDLFTYTASDAGGLQSTATVTITIQPGYTPVTITATLIQV